MQSRFEKVIVIGYGTTACDVLRYVGEKQKAYGYQTVCIEYENHGISKLHTICRQADAEYLRLTERQRVAETLLAVAGPALVISAGNTYLFPRAVVEKNNLEIINFHSALLPKYPGRNAQSWAIYEGEKVSGATWHYVAPDVDSGPIIAQRETPIPDDIKAYELTRDIMAKASEAFYDFYEQLLVRPIAGRPQPKPMGTRKIYYSWELPGGGICSPEEPADSIYRMLRAMDYGKNDIFPPAKVKLSGGTTAEVVRYGKTERIHPQTLYIDAESRRIYFAMDDVTELMIKYKETDNQ